MVPSVWARARTAPGLVRGHAGCLTFLGPGHFLDHLVRADLGQFIQGTQDGHRLPGQAQFFEKTVEDQAVVDAHLEALETQGPHQVVNDQGRLDVGGVGRRADGVEIALPELAVAALSRVLAAPHWPHVIALEGRIQILDVHGGETRKRDGEIEAQSHVAVAVVAETVNEAIRFLTAFSQENFRVFQGGGVNRGIAVGAINLAGLLQKMLARDHQLRQIVPKSFKSFRLNQIRHGKLFSGQRSAVSGQRSEPVT